MIAFASDLGGLPCGPGWHNSQKSIAVEVAVAAALVAVIVVDFASLAS